MMPTTFVGWFVTIIIGWVIIGSLFSFVVWPRLIDRLNKRYPILHEPED
jgi:hypothetical protein